MSGFFQNLLKDFSAGFFGNDYLRDYKHASKTFTPNAFENAPKLKFLFHVYFNISSFPQQLPNSSNLSLVVRSVSLPTFQIDTRTMNQYNRKRIVQTKLRYQPVSIVFLDDNGNLVRNMWYNYYKYYYGDQGLNKINSQVDDTSPSSSVYNSWERTQYMENVGDSGLWGYYGETPQINGTPRPDGKKVPFFTDITIYGFNQHNFVSYKLINPVITSFNHDTYDYNQGSGTMQNTMTIDYETVEYEQGALSGKTPGSTVPGFGNESSYDTNLSPIARPGANGSILGQGGLKDAAFGIIDNLQNGNVLGAIQTAGVTYNTFKNANLSNIIRAEANQKLGEVLTNGATNAVRNVKFNTPVFNSTPSGNPAPVENRTPVPVEQINVGP
jgi:hypothetical protein